MKPLIQIDDEVREMTDEEYAQLLADGWTPGDEPLEPAPVDEPVTEEPPALEEEAEEA
jgi:hypothetical protein